MPAELAAAAVVEIATAFGVTELDPMLYDRLREKLVLRDQRAWRHGGGLDLDLPTSDQIRMACRNPEDHEGWVSALALAGLANSRTSRGSVPVDVALERFLQDAGWLPRSRDTLVLYAQARGFAVAYHLPTVLRPHLKILRERRAAQGLWTPEPMPVGRRRPRFEVTALERAARAAYVLDATYETILDALLAALNDRSGVLTQDAYQAWSSRRPGAPSLGLVQRLAREQGKTFADARSEALALRAAGVRPTERDRVVVLDPDRVGDEIIVVAPAGSRQRVRGTVGRPLKYATDAERRAANNARRRQQRAARAAATTSARASAGEVRGAGRTAKPTRAEGDAPRVGTRRPSIYASADEAREAANARQRASRGSVPSAPSGRRRRFTRADGKPIQWDDLITAGLVTADAELWATRAGQRFTCRHGNGHFDVAGHGTVRSLTAAATLVLNGPQDGWSFWRIGSAPSTPAFKLRRQLIDQLADANG